MNSFQLNVCVDTADAALAAARAGATSIYLCSGALVGGLTPALSLLELVREVISIPLHVMIRPRLGDFLYTPLEFEQMKRDIITCKKHMADGIVLGALTADGQLDTYMLRTLIALAGDLPVTLSRAFDWCKDPLETLETAIQLGFKQLITSGQQNTALSGADCIASLMEKAHGRLDTVPTGDLNASSLEALITLTHCRSYLVEAPEVSPSLMTYTPTDVSFISPCLKDAITLGINEAELIALNSILNRTFT
ncbi:MAG: copper homeostasis protein CutC [Cellulosilyticaceae bacterium]